MADERPIYRGDSMAEFAASKGYGGPAAAKAFENGWLCALRGDSPSIDDGTAFRDGWMAFYARTFRPTCRAALENA